MKRQETVVQHGVRQHITDFSHQSLCLGAAVILINDWRRVCRENQPSLPCSAPARQPRSDRTLAYFRSITLAMENRLNFLRVLLSSLYTMAAVNK